MLRLLYCDFFFFFLSSFFLSIFLIVVEFFARYSLINVDMYAIDFYHCKRELNVFPQFEHQTWEKKKNALPFGALTE